MHLCMWTYTRFALTHGCRHAYGHSCIIYLYIDSCMCTCMYACNIHDCIILFFKCPDANSGEVNGPLVCCSNMLLVNHFYHFCLS